ncbi:hypothetical protein [Fodinibius halophilus]|uniref:Uncharacterized protein n=1 Tax=Fodinibius halophilus TaxID=1736908 RepID=A0A6M1T517_9BACT|nr:hypothetical protein [Fodinibius halophilus]NGP89137.1 hypothetical protein [Fodinibius halophilus]
MESQMKKLQEFVITATFFLLCTLTAHSVHAQADISMRVEVNETLANSKSINIKSLVANDGKGPNLFRMYLINKNSTEYVNNLYFEILISSDKVGPIAEVTQVKGQPFSLNPGQQVFATNNNISNGLPGVEEAIEFDGGLTTEGQEFVNNLGGATTLPADNYQIQINIYQGSGLQNKVASDMAEVGASITEKIQDFYLLTPGNEVGSATSIANPYPNFQWQGETGSSYRLIIVEERNNETPESLLDGAKSTSATRGNGGTGTLVGYEMLDRIVGQSNLQYPNSGVQDFVPGKTYYWRVIGLRETSSGLEEKESEIWSFTFTGNSSNSVSETPGMARVLESVLGEQFNQFDTEGYSFEAVVVDGRVYRDGQALQQLRKLMRKVENGEVSIVIERQ